MAKSLTDISSCIQIVALKLLFPNNFKSHFHLWVLVNCGSFSLPRMVYLDKLGWKLIVDSIHKLPLNYQLYHLILCFWNFLLEMFYLNTIEQLFLFVKQLYQLEVCLPYSRLLTGIPILVVFQNLRWNSNKTSL